MATPTTGYGHIVLDDGTPIIAGTTVKVIELVTEQRAYGWSPEELHFQHPHLSLGQIHAALAYYWDHVEELDADIEKRLRYADQQRQAARPSPLARRMAALKRDA